jgi:CheY-like chemotaxis protein
MSLRFVYLIDSDANLNAHLVQELSRLGFRVEDAVDSNEVMQRKDDFPSLIVLCIDPKRTGWAVCNRLRKSTTLKSTPLIITSAEATEKDFEDHKKLKTRAEEYLHKPFAVEALVEKIAGIIGMPEVVPQDEAELEIGIDAAEEISVDEEGVILEEAAPEEDPYANGGVGFGEDVEDSTRIGVNIDGEVDLETEAAFAAIGVDEIGETTNTAIVVPPVARVSSVAPVRGGAAVARAPRAELSDDDPFALPAQEHEEAAPPVVPAPLPPADSMPIQVRDKSEELDLGLDDVAKQAAAEPKPQRFGSQPRIISSAPAPAPVVAAPVVTLVSASAAPASSDTEIHDTGVAAELQKERDQLRREVEELKQKLAQRPEQSPAASGFSREREFLNLREIINKKEKEVLDLRDSLDGKERLVLDARDKARELERKVRELDERGLGMERELVAAREKVEALSNDKERVVEREKQVKARLDDALKTGARYEQELDGLKAKHAADLATSAQAHEEAVAAHQSEVASLREQHQQAFEAQLQQHGEELQQAINEHATEKSLLAAKHEEEHNRLQSQHAAALAQLKESSENERDSLRTRFEQQISEQTAQHQTEAEKLREEHAAQLQQLRSEHESAVAEKDQQHADEIAGVRARHAKDLKDAERRQQDEVAGLHENYKRALQEADDRRLQELQARAEDNRNELEALAADHAEERARLERDHVAAVHMLDERRQHELGEQAQAHAQELERVKQEGEQKLADELKTTRDSHQRKLEALEEAHADSKAGMQQRFNQQLDEIKKQHGDVVTQYDEALKQRDELNSEAQERIADLERHLTTERDQTQRTNLRVTDLDEQLRTALEDLRAREIALNERAQRIGELEQESAGYQDQILKAYQRIKSDESIVNRAKKALAIALTLLDESVNDGNEEASS